MSTSEIPVTDPTALAQFGKLDVVARLVVEGFLIGQHKSPFKGTSVEFVEHRQYYAGDEVRHIDWRAWGKTGKYFIKEFEDETNLRCYLIVDASGSMRYAGKTISKYDYARQLAAALAYLLVSQRDAVGLLTFDTRIRDHLEPTTRPQSFLHITQSLEDREPGRETSIARVFQEILPRIKRRSLLVIISDCFDELAPLQAVLAQCRHQRHEVLLFQIAAPEEESFPFTHATQFRNIERPGQKLLVDPHRWRKGYLERYKAFSEELVRIAGSNGVMHQKFVTSEPYATALGAFLAARTRGRSKRRG